MLGELLSITSEPPRASFSETSNLQSGDGNGYTIGGSLLSSWFLIFYSYCTAVQLDVFAALGFVLLALALIARTVVAASRISSTRPSLTDITQWFSSVTVPFSYIFLDTDPVVLSEAEITHPVPASGQMEVQSAAARTAKVSFPTLLVSGISSLLRTITGFKDLKSDSISGASSGTHQQERIEENAGQVMGVSPVSQLPPRMTEQENSDEDAAYEIRHKADDGSSETAPIVNNLSAKLPEATSRAPESTPGGSSRSQIQRSSLARLVLIPR